MTNLNKKLIWTVLFGVAVLLTLTFTADFKSTVQALGKFKTIYLPLILGLTFINYLLRFVKWQYFLRQIGVYVSLKESFVVFLSGLAMTVTPGKAGELLKSLLLKEIKGAPVGRTAPVVFAERLSDGFGLIILSLSGMALFRYGAQVLTVIALILAAMIIVIKTPWLFNYFIGMCAKIPIVKRFTGVIENLFHSAGLLLTFRSLVFAIAISVVSWSFESIAFYYVFAGLGYQVPLVVAVFTLAFSSIVGSVSMLPGGLGAAEGSIMGLLIEVAGVPAGIAAVATIIIRFCTLWFGVVLGLLAIFTSRRLINYVNKMGPDNKEEEAL